MLDKQPNRVLTFFAADFGTQLGPNVAAAAQRAYTSFDPLHTNFVPLVQYKMVGKDGRRIFTLTHNRAAWGTLGFDAWTGNQEACISIITEIRNELGVEIYNRLGFKVVAYMNLEMSHDEMCDLMFESFLLSKRDLNGVFGEARDPLIQIEGNYEEFDYVAIVAPMNREQMSKSMMSLPNISDFRAEKNARLDSGVMTFHDEVVRHDSLVFDVDFFQRDVAVSRLRQFARESSSAAQAMSQSCVDRFLSRR